MAGDDEPLHEREWRSTGQSINLNPDVMGRELPDWNPTAREHLWVMVSTHQVDIALWQDPDHVPYLDHETLLSIVGPGCLHCERSWSAQLARRNCQGPPR